MLIGLFEGELKTLNVHQKEAMRGKLGQQKSFTSAPFALQMIEGVQKVRFVSKG